MGRVNIKTLIKKNEYNLVFKSTIYIKDRINLVYNYLLY